MAIEAPVHYDITLVEGTDYFRTWYWQNNDGTPLDFSGYSAWEMSIVDEYTGAASTLSTSSATITVAGNAAGELTVSIAESNVNAAAGVWSRRKYSLTAHDGTRRVPVMMGLVYYQRSSMA